MGRGEKNIAPPTIKLFQYVFQRARGDNSDKTIKHLEMFVPPDKKFPQAKIRFKITDANILWVCHAGVIKFYSQSEWLQANGIHSPSDERFSIVVATFTNSSGVEMSS